MRKRVWGLLFVSVFLILTASFILATEHDLTEQEKVDKAYQCLEDKTDNNCDSLSNEEKIFSLLAIGECKSELLSASQNDGECWPSVSSSTTCDIKTTAQAVIALDNINANTDSAKDWLKSQNTIPGGIEWFLEIDTQNSSSCAITYSSSGQTFNTNILENKKLENSAGSCLSLAQDNYWLRVSPSCFSEEFEISCEDSFLTTLLFSEVGSPTIHVLEKTSSASAQGSTFETVNSTCFGSSASGCDYEGSLWAAMALDFIGEDVSSYMPYLIIGADENQRLIPETFLYFLTSNTDYRSQVLLGQKSSKWWSQSGDRYYDTALAMFPFQGEDPIEKSNSKSWLLTAQDGEGCWQGNIRNTAFILASLWPKSVSSGGGGGGGPDVLDCETAGYYCMSGASCRSGGGNLLGEFSCTTGVSKCCDKQQQPIETCFEKGGDICSSGERCQGEVFSVGGLRSGESCCVGGFCETISGPSDLTVTECESEGASCDFTCDSNEVEISLSCGSSSGEICCKFQPKKSSGGSFWIWFFLILITLVIVGIVFRDKLRRWFLGLKLKFGKGKGPSTRSTFGPGPGSRPSRIPPRRPLRRIPERKILLPGSSRTPSSSQVKPQPKRFRKHSKSQKELDEVLKKLKEMSK